MRYEIKIEKAQEAEGSINLERIASMARGILKISEGALNIRLKGISITKGKRSEIIQKAFHVTLTGIDKGSTVLSINAKTFQETLQPYQLNLFRQEQQKDLAGHTPVSLFITTFQQAMDEKKNKNLLDKPLLNELKQFRKAFNNDEETFIFTNQDTIPVLRIQRQDFERIRTLESTIPEPEPVIINGKVEELKYSKLRVKIQTDQGNIDGFLSEDISSDEIAGYWGKLITISGISHYKPEGKTIIEIKNIYEPGEGDRYFSRKPTNETVEEQIQRQQKETGLKNQLSSLVDQWPGNEDFDKLLNMLSK